MSRYLYLTLYVNTKIRVGPDGNSFRVIRVIYACAVNANICEQSLARNHVRFEGGCKQRGAVIT